MELGKVALVIADPAAARVGTDAGTAATLPLAPGNGGAGAPDSAPVNALADEVNIHPLDVAGALQILIAEVRAALTFPRDVPGDALRAELALLDIAVRGDYSTLAGTALQATTASAATAPLLLVQMLLNRLPVEESQEPAEWLAATNQAEAALRSGMDKAVDAVRTWRNVPALVLDVATDTRAVVLAAVGDDPPSPLWLRPEWVGLAPRMERFWRRRRRARRQLRDPDAHGQAADPYVLPDGRES